MTRILVLAVLALALTPGLAGAASPAKPAPIDFSRVRCEDPQNTKLIRESLRQMTFADGTPASTVMGNNSKLTATTISASRDKLVCRITVNYQYNGSSRDVRGRYTVRNLADGRIKEEFVPLY